MIPYPSLSFLCAARLRAYWRAVRFADTVTLKNGEHLEGKITKETDKDITMAVQVSAGITDERPGVAKAEIEKIEKQRRPEVEAYQAIAAIQLAPTSFAVAQYDPYIRALEEFRRQVSEQFACGRCADDARSVQGGKEARGRRGSKDRGPVVDPRPGGEGAGADRWAAGLRLHEKPEHGGRLSWAP